MDYLFSLSYSLIGITKKKKKKKNLHNQEIQHRTDMTKKEPLLLFLLVLHTQIV